MAKFEQKHISQIKHLAGNYFPNELAVYDEKTLRKEYSRLRSIVEKRLTSFVRAGTQQAEFYQEYRIRNRFLTLKDLEKSKVDAQHDMKYVLTHELSRMYDALSNPTSSNAKFQEYKAKRLENMKNIGIDFIETDADFFLWERLTKEVQERGLGNLIYEETVRKHGKYNRTYKQMGFDLETTKRLFDMYKKHGQEGIDDFIANAMWATT